MAVDDRDETPDERADRNWNDLLQELRVSQTGVQLLAGFLATLPFQSRFTDLDAFQRGWYVGLLALAFATVGVTLAPVAIHRRVFRAGVKEELVSAGHRLTVAALGMIAVLLGGIVFLVVDVVYDRAAASWSAAGAVAVLAGLLVVLPARVARR
ncbi:sodium:proton antiporter [Nocardioides alpinus]|nr:sodium:proton antiporter [Nocardioides alpinus]